MDPYRTPQPFLEISYKPRSKWKTLKLKLLIKYRGKWRDRFVRCQYCRTVVMPNDHHWNTEMFFHQIKCLGIHLNLKTKHMK